MAVVFFTFASLTDGRTVRNLPMQHRDKKTSPAADFFPVVCYPQRSSTELLLALLALSHVSPSSGLVKLLALSNQQACVSSARRVCLTGLQLSFVVLSLSTYHCVDCVEYPYQCTLRLWYLETPMTFVQRTGTVPLFDRLRQILRL